MDTYFLVMKYIKWVAIALLIVCLFITLKKLLGLAQAAKPVVASAKVTKEKAEKVQLQAEGIQTRTKKTVSLLSKGLSFYILAKAIFNDYQESDQNGLVQLGNSTNNVMRKRAMKDLSKAEFKKLF